MRLALAVLASIFGLAAFAAANAQGCGPTRLKVSESVSIDLPPAKVWELVGNFQNMSWDPDVVATSGHGGNLPDAAARRVTLRNGMVLGDSLYKYDATAMSYSYHIDTVDVARLPIQNAAATLDVLPAADGTKAVVRWKSAFYRNLAPGEGAPDAADARAVRAMTDFFRAGLRGLKEKAGS